MLNIHRNRFTAAKSFTLISLVVFHVPSLSDRQEEMGRQHQGMDRSGVRQVPDGSGEQGKMEETGGEIICGAPTTLAVKG